MGPPAGGKQAFLRNILERLLLSFVLVIALRFAYVVIIRVESCDMGEFCFVTGVGQLRKSASSAVVIPAVGTAPFAPKKIPILWSTKSFQETVMFYSSVFQDLMSESVLNPNSKTLCVDTAMGADVFALKEIGVEDSVGISERTFKPMVIARQGFQQPFGDNTIDFVFCGGGAVEKSARPGDLAAEIDRTLKPQGFLVIHTGTNDTYSFHSLLSLFSFCKFVKSKDAAGFDSEMPFIRQIVLQKFTLKVEKSSNASENKCSFPSYKQDLIKRAEPLISEEPNKPWVTLKKNVQKVKYLPSMVDINFKAKYMYIDIGSRSYGSSIVSWFKKQYPKQNKTFEIYAIEADRAFHNQYRSKKGVTLLPYAAWVRNETLFFEINDGPGKKDGGNKGRGMGRIQRVQSSGKGIGDVDRVQGFDFAEWLKKMVTERDYVVMKMDVEGTEFDLIPRLFETGGICLIDELFLECHYNRWQKCCPGERTTKYQKTYGQCLELFTSLRQSGVLVHQWW